MMVVPFLHFQLISQSAARVRQIVEHLRLTPSPCLGRLPATDADQVHCNDQQQDQSKQVHQARAPRRFCVVRLALRSSNNLRSNAKTLNKQHAVSDTEGHKIFASGYADAVACLLRIFARSVRHGRPRQASMSTR